jgi:hypothetical protein
MDERFALAWEKVIHLAESDPTVSGPILKDVIELLGVLQHRPSKKRREQSRDHQTAQSLNQPINTASSPAKRYFKDREWDKATFSDLREVAAAMAHVAEIPMERAHRRWKNVMFKWLDQNWQRLKPIADQTELVWNTN